MAKDKLRNKLIGYIEDAYAMENQIVEILERQVDLTKEHASINGRIKQHLAETQVQRRRMQECLKTYDREPSMLKSAMSNVLGNLVGIGGGLRRDALSRTLRDNYTTEHLEIAAYTLLITTARLVGDEATVKAAEATMREEIAMAEWCAAHLPDSLLMDLDDEGIAVPSVVAAQGPKLTVTFEPTIGEQIR